MKTKPIILSIVLFWTYTVSPIVLENSKGLITTFIDGYSFGIDGTMFGLMLKIRKQLIETIIGKQGVGMFHHNGIKYTLQELRDLEQHSVEIHNQQELKQLQKTLIAVTNTLNAHLAVYAKLAQGVKQYLLVFITESCQKHGKKSNILQNWAKIKEGHEAQQLKKDLIDLNTALDFCWDLIHFLEDMCDSCPKAQKQFKELIEKAQR